MCNVEENMDMEILTPKHERWHEFVCEMVGELVCCDSTNETTRAILSKMQGIDVDKTLEFFESLRGYHDCEVLMNVVAKHIGVRTEVDGE